MENLEEEINNVKIEILKIKEELKRESESKETESEHIDRLDNAVKEAAIKPFKKLTYWKKVFTYALIGSKIVVFAAFIYTSAVLYNLGKTTESVLVLFAVALYLILNKLEGG